MSSTTHIVKGIAIHFKHGNWLVTDAQFVSPGKGSAFTRTKLKNLKTGQAIEHTFRSGESVETIDVQRNKAQYLYSDASDYHFMETDTYEQFALSADAVGDMKKYLLDDTDCYILKIDGNPISVQVPAKMEFTITSTPPGEKGNTATGGNKEAVLETGLVIKVPLFLKEGEKIIINTENDTYVSKA